MKITDVEAIVLRQAAVNEGIADGSQDDLVILRPHRRGDHRASARSTPRPRLVQALVHAPRLARRRDRPARRADRRGPARRRAALGQDVPRRSSTSAGAASRSTRSAGSTSRSGTSRARRSASRSASCSARRSARPGARLRLDADARHARGDPPSASPRCASRASPRSSSAGARSARTRRTTSRSPRPPRRPAASGVEIMIDAGLGYVADAATAIRVARELERARHLLARGAVRAGRVRGLRRARRRASTSAIAAGEQDATRWGFRELIERGHVDLVQPDVTRCGGITETLRIAELAARARRRRPSRTRGRAGSSRPPRCT